MRARRWWVLLLLLALIAAACTNADDDESTEPEGGEAAEDDDVDAGSEDTDDATSEDPADDGDEPDDAPLEASDVGVTEETIKIGLVSFDSATLVDLGFAEDVGDPLAGGQRIVDDINSNGGVHGRKIELVTELWNPLAPDILADLQRACLVLTEDEQVFAVASLIFFGDAVTCVAGDHDTPLLGTGTLPASVIESGNGNIFLINFQMDRAVSSLATTMGNAGELDDIETIGSFGMSEAGMQEVIDEALKPALAAVGHTLDIEALVPVETGGTGPETAAAVTRFKEDGVDGVFLLGNLFANGAFMTEAEKQGYNPRYFLSDLSEGTTDQLITQAPASQLEGSRGTTWRRTGRAEAGIAPSEFDLNCVENYGSETAAENEAELGGTAELCLQFDLIIGALTDAGRNPTREGFVAALESVGEFETGAGGSASFSPERHDAIDEVKRVEWQIGCECWVQVSDYEPVAEVAG